VDPLAVINLDRSAGRALRVARRLLDEPAPVWDDGLAEPVRNRDLLVLAVPVVVVLAGLTAVVAGVRHLLR
jgi:hypothetical protein